MKVEKVRDVTTAASAVTYEVTLRVNTVELREEYCQFPTTFAIKLTDEVLRAINGIATYPYAVTVDERKSLIERVNAIMDQCEPKDARPI
jgi:hypothetical protein